MKKSEPTELREFPVVNDQYDDEDSSCLPLFDEGYFDDDDVYE